MAPHIKKKARLSWRRRTEETDGLMRLGGGGTVVYRRGGGRGESPHPH